MSFDMDFPRMIRTYIASVWALELLLLMRAEATRWWQPKELSDELRATVPLVETCLKRFRRLGLVVGDENGLFRFGPASPGLRGFCDQLSDEFRERPVSVITLIAAPEDRIQQLADAFRFRGNKPQ
jgi:hypothetical protein